MVYIVGGWEMGSWGQREAAVGGISKVSRKRASALAFMERSQKLIW